jgi:hypothetical protein
MLLISCFAAGFRWSCRESAAKEPRNCAAGAETTVVDAAGATASMVPRIVGIDLILLRLLLRLLFDDIYVPNILTGYSRSLRLSDITAMPCDRCRCCCYILEVRQVGLG